MFETDRTFREPESIIRVTAMTNEERMQREANLIARIRAKLPDFARMCADDSELVMLHQDSFAADYQDDEYTHPPRAGHSAEGIAASADSVSGQDLGTPTLTPFHVWGTRPRQTLSTTTWASKKIPGWRATTGARTWGTSMRRRNPRYRTYYRIT